MSTSNLEMSSRTTLESSISAKERLPTRVATVSLLSQCSCLEGCKIVNGLSRRWAGKRTSLNCQKGAFLNCFDSLFRGPV